MVTRLALPEARAKRKRASRAWQPIRAIERGPDSGFHIARRTAKDGKGRVRGGSMLVVFRTVARDRQERVAIPFRPLLTRGGSMCAEQLADLKAAQNGAITWAQYFQKWGPSL